MSEQTVSIAVTNSNHSGLKIHPCPSNHSYTMRDHGELGILCTPEVMKLVDDYDCPWLLMAIIHKSKEYWHLKTNMTVSVSTSPNIHGCNKWYDDEASVWLNARVFNESLLNTSYTRDKGEYSRQGNSSRGIRLHFLLAFDAGLNTFMLSIDSIKKGS